MLSPELADRGYQLLTATVGTAIEAGRRHCPNAVFLVHAFRRTEPSTSAAKRYANADDDFAAFCRVLGITPPNFGTVSNPVSMRETNFAPGGVRLFVGKCVTYLD